MAIIIQNISEDYGKEYGKGEQVYVLRINRIIKCIFNHNFEDGLAECLRKAAEAFELGETGNVE
jgi:hypothetical protein